MCRGCCSRRARSGQASTSLLEEYTPCPRFCQAFFGLFFRVRPLFLQQPPRNRPFKAIGQRRRRRQRYGKARKRVLLLPNQVAFVIRVGVCAGDAPARGAARRRLSDARYKTASTRRRQTASPDWRRYAAPASPRWRLPPAAPRPACPIASRLIHLSHDGWPPSLQAARLRPGTSLPEQTQRRDCSTAAAYKAHHGAMPRIRSA